MVGRYVTCDSAKVDETVGAELLWYGTCYFLHVCRPEQ